VLLLGPTGPRGLPASVRYLLAAGVASGVAAVATSLVGMGWHYSSDTLGGLGVAIACVGLAALGIDAVAEHSTRPRRKPL
jgi:membrane-associated phospholipid phosphatase